VQAGHRTRADDPSGFKRRGCTFNCIRVATSSSSRIPNENNRILRGKGNSEILILTSIRAAENVCLAAGPCSAGPLWREVVVSYICHDGVAAARSESRATLPKLPLACVHGPAGVALYESPTAGVDRFGQLAVKPDLGPARGWSRIRAPLRKAALSERSQPPALQGRFYSPPSPAFFP